MSVSVTKQRDLALLLAFRSAAKAAETPGQATGRVLQSLWEPAPEPTAAEAYYLSILRTAIAGSQETEEDNGDPAED